MEYCSRKMILILSCLVIFSIFNVRADLEISNVDRSIDLSSQLAKVNSQITLQNKGNKAVTSFLISIEEDQFPLLSYLEVTHKEDDESVKLETTPSSVAGQSAKLFSVNLPSSLGVGKSIVLNIESVFTHALRPFPAKIGQSEKQLVIYKANTYFSSPYKVVYQKTTVKLSSSTIESYSKLKPSNSADNTITYGPYNDINPYSFHEMKIHFENNSPFLTVKDMTRWIEVSHWGNVAIEETYHLLHEGAELKGHFSRYDYQRTPSHAAVKSIKSVLPAAAKDVYYRDEIGNISTSNLLNTHDSVELELRPRFPLFGGWQTQYLIGYNVAVYEYLFRKGSNYVLKMRFIDHVFDDFVIDKVTVKVVLPEGATNIKVKFPFEIKQEKQELHKTYLDTCGRPVFVMSKKNLVENHIQDFELHYTFQSHLLLQEPILCVAAFYILFISVICIMRLDFSITKDAVNESRMKVASLVESLLAACDRRTGLNSSFDSALDNFKQSKDQVSFTSALKKVNHDYNTLCATINNLIASLLKEEPEYSDKLSDITKKEAERKALIDQQVALATKAVSGKLSKQQYTDSEQIALSKREKITEEIEATLAALS
ncbi:dolichyl-diphosphooligosaccharide--protein glycosyltransferase subunit 1 isoform X1 [Hydra vulgaris]|uniref:Dolichyl-diphosphooligosaccharide--protein glycosyltransferase subunit 1 n=1 Tax=Hydra vulgaris TaxID=6087 RepID=T2MHV5_HYDVU|nr:dolichyl-diphosphooligosaccharide--protein glycosyltransferase subunit 1 [Hydra vulgaris]